MKTLVVVICCLAAAALLLYVWAHESVYETIYPRVAREIEAVGLSDTGEVLVSTRNGYIIVSVLEAAKNYPNGFQRRSDIMGKPALPKWSDMTMGPVPKQLWQKYKPVPIIRNGTESTKYFDQHDRHEVDAIVTFENEAYSYGEDFAWLELRLYSNRPLYVLSA